MLDISIRLVEELVKVETMKSTVAESLAAWGEDIPVTVLLSNIGKGLARNFDFLSSADKAHIFGVIETGMADQALSAPIATGMLEALFLASRDEHKPISTVPGVQSIHSGVPAKFKFPGL